jgi:uncharacterized protein (DUF302 family)
MKLRRNCQKRLPRRDSGSSPKIDVAATLEKKIGVTRSPYKILGACNPTLANRALEAEEDIGLLLPCNVVLYRKGDATTIEALEPRTMSQMTGNDELGEIAEQARAGLVRALSSL